MRRVSTASFVVAVVVLAGLATAAPPEDVRAAIEAKNKAFTSAVARGDAAAIAALYTSTAEVLPPGGEIARGREAIQKAFQGAIDAGMRDLPLTLVEVEAHGDTATEVGTWVWKGKDGATLDHGKYIVIWKKEGGDWRLHRDIWNSSTPPPAK
ncbi:MAG TPA: DUF4440 domain-containing protein [Vicinamibacteria bacterium]|nr:DUF4440 domain-containing protein [Vicinamibacteria bacterium]